MIPNLQTVAIMGATATGKSDLAIRLAERIPAEIISMDSRQVYRGFDVGTGKVSPEDRARVPHHLIDILNPHEKSTAGSHVALATGASDQIAARGNHPIFVGGTGLYFRVLFRGIIDERLSAKEKEAFRRSLEAESTEELHRRLEAIDPRRAGSLSARDRVRIVRALEIRALTGRGQSELVAEQSATPQWSGLKIVLTLPRPLLRRRIDERTRFMYSHGWVEEVRSLIERGVGLDAPAMGSLGYAVIARAVLEGGDPHATVDHVVTLTRQYAKRQETFFRTESDAHWVDVSEASGYRRVFELVLRHLGL
jgi:tRNA dimethylallyltransferase